MMQQNIGFKFRCIHHPAFATSKLDQTIRYWRDLLGFKLLLGLSKEGERQYFFGISDSFMIAFFEWPRVQPAHPKRHGEPVTGPFIFDHLAIQMESRRDLHRLQDRLIGSGLPVSDIIDHGFIQSIYTHDPNGIPLEFNVPTEGISLYHNPVIADSHPPNIAMESFDPKPQHWPTLESTEDSERAIVPGEGYEVFNE